MQTITIEIDGLEDMISTALDRVLGAIDPTIAKFKNTTIEILSVLEARIKANVSETLHWFETNLFVILFAAILFFIVVLWFINNLDDLLIKYDLHLIERRFVALIIITGIIIWLFIAMVLSTWPPVSKFNLQTLKYVFVGLLGLTVVCLAIISIVYLYIHCNHISTSVIQMCHNRKKVTVLQRGKPTGASGQPVELTTY